MNPSSRISQYLSCLPISCLSSNSQTSQATKAGHGNAFWEGRKVDQMVPLQVCSYTSLSLKALECQDDTNLFIPTIWDRAKSGDNLDILSDEPTKLVRFDSGSSTDIAMSDTGFSKGIHILDIEWPTLRRGSHPVIGVALEGTPKHGKAYTNLLGSTESSWGWNIENNKLIHNGQTIGNYPKDESNSTFNAPEKISCIIDMNAGTIGFKTNGKYLGDAFSGLKHKTVFLAVNVVRSYATISVKYIKGSNTPLSLQELSKLSVRSRVQFEEQIAHLPTAPPLKRFIADKEMTDDVEGNDSNSSQ